MRVAVLAAVFTVALLQVSVAQTPEKILAGVQTVRLVVETPGEASVRCGINRETLESSVLLPLSASEIRNLGSSDVILQAGIGSLYMPQQDICTSSIYLQVHSPLTVKLNFQETAKPLNGILWRRGMIIGSHAATHRRQVVKKMKALTRQFLMDWDADQTP